MPREGDCHGNGGRLRLEGGGAASRRHLKAEGERAGPLLLGGSQPHQGALPTLSRSPLTRRVQVMAAGGQSGLGGGRRLGDHAWTVAIHTDRLTGSGPHLVPIEGGPGGGARAAGVEGRSTVEGAAPRIPDAAAAQIHRQGLLQTARPGGKGGRLTHTQPARRSDRITLRSDRAFRSLMQQHKSSSLPPSEAQFSKRAPSSRSERGIQATEG